MRKKVQISVFAAFTLASLSVDSFAQSNVKVALLDMSAMMGMGTVGMMGPGMGMMGPGMGMMGPGMMGQGMMGQGMGMMGMMALRLDPDNVKTGEVTFDVMNWSRSTIHEMVVVAVSSSSSQLPYDYSQAKVREDQVKVIGETPELKPSESKTVQFRLEPGTYFLICNVPGHYAAGMAATLVVAQ